VSLESLAADARAELMKRSEDPDYRGAIDRLSRNARHSRHSSVLEDPRVRVIPTDGRNYILATPELYDVITAEQARAYKPTPPIFYYALRRLGCDKSDILHVAQGFNYDMMPAHGLGWERVWINRNGRPGNQDDYGPYQELTDLTGLPALLGI